MDYVVDSYFWNIDSSEIIYNNKRIFAKLYVFFKFIGLIFYISTLSACNNPDFYISMILVMFLSIINSVRYEYAHYMRYGTIFSSLNEFEEWKKEQYPKLRVFFSSIELAIKILFFIKTFPPQCEFRNLCEIGESIFKIHILVLFISYITACFCSIGFYCTFNSHNNSYYESNRQRDNISSPNPILIIHNPNEECCICMDVDNTSEWAILPCCHKFHSSCISTWLLTQKTCPVCRIYM
jgi:hypothetical protein